MTISTNSIAAFFRQLASIAAVVIGALGTGGIPGEVRAVLVAGGALIIAVEHLVTGVGQLGNQKIKTTTTTTTKATTTS